MEFWPTLHLIGRLDGIRMLSKIVFGCFGIRDTVKLRRRNLSWFQWIKFWLLYPIITIASWLRKRGKTFGIAANDFMKQPFPTDREWKSDQPNPKKEVDGLRLTAGCMKDGKPIVLSVTIINQNSRGYVEVEMNLLFGGQLYRLPKAEQRIYAKAGESGEHEFVGEGLSLTMTSPFRRWKVNFNGYLREESSAGKLHLIKLEGWAVPISDAFVRSLHTSTQNVALVLAEAASFKSAWNVLHKIAEKQNTFDQLTQLTCRIGIDGVTEEMEEYVLKGNKERISGDIDALEDVNWSKTLVSYFSDGTYIYLNVCNFLAHSSEVVSGYIMYPHGQIYPIDNVNVQTFTQHSFHSGDMLLISTDFACTPIQTSHLMDVPESSSGQSSFVGEVTTEGQFYSLQLLSGNKASGYAYVTTSKESTKRPLVPLPQPAIPKPILQLPKNVNEYDVINLRHKYAQCSSLTGGKASKLSVLMGIQNEFTVPSGLAVTTSAYNAFVDNHSELQSLFKPLNRPGKLSDTELRSQCDRIMEAIMSSSFPIGLLQRIVSQLKREFGGDFEDIDFAVRSSAVGEDGNELSSAGQLETYLFQKGLDAITNSVQKCWASNFRQEVVGYRRQHGQFLLAPVSVVIQRMIHPDAAGVMFTVDPVNKDPLLTVLNAIPGVGEAVVDGSVTPDSIQIRLQYGKREFSVEKVEIGSSGASEACLNSEQACALAKIGAEIAADFGAPQDIEWAFKDGEFFILQSRGITSLSMDSHWMYLHEFDSGVLGANDCPCTSNVGEVVPDAVSPLGISCGLMPIDRMNQAQMAKQGFEPEIKSQRIRLTVIYRNRMLFNMVESVYRNMKQMRPEDLFVFEIVFAGHSFDEPRIAKFAGERFPPISTWLYLKALVIQPFYLMFNGKKFSDAGEEHLKNCNYREDLSTRSIGQLLSEDIPDRVSKMSEQCFHHIHSSMFSMFWIMVSCGMLKPKTSGDFGYYKINDNMCMRDIRIGLRATHVYTYTSRMHRFKFTEEHLQDISAVFNSCQDAISADAPNGLKRIARAIFEAGQRELFKGLNETESVNWLKNEAPADIQTQFADFIKIHGHRCPQEFDVGRVPWRKNPQQLISSIKSLLIDEKNLMTEKTVISPEEALKSLKAPLSWFSKKFMQWAIPQARKGVEYREIAKNRLIFAVDKVRQGWEEYGERLQSLGYLPDAQLIFYMTVEEAEDIVKSRSARIVARAMQRKKIMKEQDALKFHEVNFGNPKPIEANLDNNFKSVMSLKGTAVYMGCVRAKARVAENLEEASHTQPGEILITRSTDIGWSPLFPIISGIVTELGGLLSHGAVVAREYGLPCLIGVSNATNCFKTGDEVILDAFNGIIKKISVHDDNDKEN